MPTNRPRAAVVVTGSELVRGERSDLNGPYLARELESLGFVPARIVVVGDDPSELEQALRHGLTFDLCTVSGGLGPTHDDRTVEMLARAAGVPVLSHSDLEAEIGAVTRTVAERLRRPYADFADGVRKQAMLPAGAVVLGLAGTAPGFILQSSGATVVVLPGPPAELRLLWPRALEAEPVRALLRQARPPGHRTLRFYGVSESTVAQALDDAGGEAEGVVVTICARDFEIHVDLLVEPEAGAESRAGELVARLHGELGRFAFAEDERPIEEIVLGLCRTRAVTLATAESCTGGMVATRLTSIPGASDVFRGAIVAYADDVKSRELAVSEAVLRAKGAVSPETAALMAAGARERLRADVAVAVTGIAGPSGGTAEKPVGLVYIHAESPDASRGIEFTFPADRESIRRRATVAALHLVRRILEQSPDESL